MVKEENQLKNMKKKRFLWKKELITKTTIIY